MTVRGVAGRTGDDARSDLQVTVELRRSGGLGITLASKVEALYGQSIVELTEGLLSELGVEHATIAIEDQGALPFVIAARLETAVRRAGAPARGDGRPPCTVPRRAASPQARVRRSRLYLPGNEPKFLVNAGLHRPDAVILDLEDSVHPAEKDAARILVRNALRCVDFLGAERMVRINQLPAGLEDLEMVVPEHPDLVLIPKTERPDAVRRVHEQIRTIQDREKDADPIWLMPILESALGVEHAFDIARAVDSVAALTVGLEDYTADLGVAKTRHGEESLFARMRLVNAARAAGVQAIDSVYGDIADVDGLAAWGARSRALGFDGMGCVHPRQIDVVHQAFAPPQAELDKALQIVAAFEQAQAQGLAVVSLGTRMIDPPVVLRAQRLVDRARRSGLLPETADRGGAP
jgi:citrate lyase subunit beta/citryl-CoA lyase